MHKKMYAPIIVSSILVIIGVSIGIAIYYDWKNTSITTDSDVIHEVESNSDGLDLKTIIHEAEKNVMLIEGQQDQHSTAGSGFLYNDRGDIITNAHVVKNADIIYVRTSNARVYPAAVVGMGDKTDIAVIRVPQLAGQTPLEVEKETKAEISDEVIALGSPHGFQNTVTLGIISGTERNFSVDGFDYNNVYQISAQITEGNSGGPLIKRETGKVVGINSVGTNDGTLGFSIPIDEVIDQIEQWSNETQNDQLEFASTSDIVDKINSEQLEEDAAYIIDYFFESISIRDYVGAYALLGSEIQGQHSYADFREGYIHTINIEYDEPTMEITEDKQASVSTTVTMEEKLPNEEENNVTNISYYFTLGYENDQLKILNISNEEE
ncbi:S1C family serine protease [Oceanobacillus halotolerans]|uniref:S1C family serine protease n=1 Tax=Oceanobacillus halotolerans TaxID=2663380 RepID=UPI0013D90B23|nr:trypsin-like peptidase domain-containing protein [Oceanobacillus halotolerans]